MYINYIQNKIQVLMCSRYIVHTVSRKMVALTKIPRLLLIEETRRRLTISIVRTIPSRFILRRHCDDTLFERSLNDRPSADCRP